MRASTFRPERASNGGRAEVFAGLTHNSGRLPRTPTRNRARLFSGTGSFAPPSTCSTYWHTPLVEAVSRNSSRLEPVGTAIAPAAIVAPPRSNSYLTVCPQGELIQAAIMNDSPASTLSGTWIRSMARSSAATRSMAR